jgi:hypothetical protein
MHVSLNMSRSMLSTAQQQASQATTMHLSYVPDLLDRALPWLAPEPARPMTATPGRKQLLYFLKMKSLRWSMQTIQLKVESIRLNKSLKTTRTYTLL